jgi:hypothetical protein
MRCKRAPKKPACASDRHVATAKRSVPVQHHRGSGTHFANSLELGAVDRVRRVADCPAFLKHPIRPKSITLLGHHSFSIVVTREIFGNHIYINNLERIVCIDTYGIS